MPVNNPLVTIDRHTVKLIASMLRGYAFLLSSPPTDSLEVDGLLDDECAEAIKIRLHLLNICRETA